MTWGLNISLMYINKYSPTQLLSPMGRSSATENKVVERTQRVPAQTPHAEAKPQREKSKNTPTEYILQGEYIRNHKKSATSSAETNSRMTAPNPASAPAKYPHAAIQSYLDHRHIGIDPIAQYHQVDYYA